jgi:hypothetical protein
VNLRIGVTGYVTLRADLYAPIDTPERFHALLPALKAITGEYPHWIPLKELAAPDSWIPPDDASDLEKIAHQSCIHYGDSMRPMLQWMNSLPAKDRFAEAVADPFDWRSLQYALPELDVIIVEASAMIGASYALDQVIQELYRLNPCLGIIVSDLDIASISQISKMKKWHPDWQSRVVTATQFPTRYRAKNARAQVVSMHPHIQERELPLAPHTGYIAYVGNDYDRRDQMRRLFADKRLNWFGRVKDEPRKNEFFRTEMDQVCTLRPPIEPTGAFNVEHVYNAFGTGVNVSRHKNHLKQLVTIRISQINRGGAIAFGETQMPITYPVLTEWCHVNSAADLFARNDVLGSDQAYREELFNYQRDRLRYFFSVDRYVYSLWETAKVLYQGNVDANWYFNPYQDLWNK